MSKKMSSLFLCAVFVSNLFGAMVEIVGEQPLDDRSGGLADSPWPMFRGNVRHTGLSPYDTSGNPGTLKWAASAPGTSYSSPAIGPDGTIYVGSQKNILYAFNPDGSQKWNYTANGVIQSSPAIGSDGTIYFGSADNKFYAVNSDGTQKWNFTTGRKVMSSPAIGPDGTIYFTSMDFYIYALNPSGTQKWRYKTGYVTESSPAVGSDGTIYVGSDDHKLYALSSNGTLKWSFTTEDIVESSPAIGSDDTIYIGSDDNKLYAINPNGTQKWNFTTGDDINACPGIGPDGTIYIGSGDNKFYAINPDGTKKWSFTTGGIIYSSSAAIGSDGTIFFGSFDHNLYALDPDGTQRWSFLTDWGIYSSQAINSDGTIYFAGSQKLYAFGTPFNQPPIANAGLDQTVLEGDMVYFDGSSSYDPDGTIVDYDWDFDDGSPHSKLKNPRYIFNYAGDYDVTLTVTDDNGTTSSDTCLIKVLPVIKPPVADAGPDQMVYIGDTVYFDGSGSYATVGSIKSLEWDFDSKVDSDGDGNTTNDVDAQGATTTHVYNNEGVYNVTLKVTTKVEISQGLKVNQDVVFVMDSSGSMAWTDPEDLRIEAAKNYVDKLNPDDRGCVVDFDTDAMLLPDGWPVGDHLGTDYDKIKSNLDLVDSSGGTTISEGLSLAIEELRLYGNSDNVHVIILLTDAENTDSEDNDICINLSKVAAQRDIKIFTIGLSIKSNSTGEKLLMDLANNTDGGYFPAPNASYLEEIYQEISKLVENITVQEMSDYDNCEITVLSAVQPPVANAGSDQIVNKGDIVAFDGSASYDPDGTIVSYEWDFGDGTTHGTGVNPTHVYNTPGNYSVTLTITDDDGATDTDFCLIIVMDVNKPPIADGGLDQTANEKDIVQFDGFGSYDPDGKIVLYEWDFEARDGLWWETGAPPDAIGPTPTHVYGDDGEFIVTLRVTDNDNLSATDICNITVHNVDPIVTIESVIMEVEIGLRVSGRKYNNVSMVIYEVGDIIGQISIERLPGSPNEQMKWIPYILDMTKTYSATVTFEPEDPPDIGGNPVWIYVKFENGSIRKIHHTFNVQQSKKRDSEHWNHVDPWEVDLNAELIGCPFEVTYYVMDPGSDDEIFTFSYGSQTVNITHLNDPPNPDPYPSPEINPVDLTEITTLIYEGSGTIILSVEDDDKGTASASLDIL